MRTCGDVVAELIDSMCIDCPLKLACGSNYTQLSRCAANATKKPGTFVVSKEGKQLGKFIDVTLAEAILRVRRELDHHSMNYNMVVSDWCIEIVAQGPFGTIFEYEICRV